MWMERAKAVENRILKKNVGVKQARSPPRRDVDDGFARRFA
jgi:hypothetical protein